MEKLTKDELHQALCNEFDTKASKYSHLANHNYFQPYYECPSNTKSAVTNVYKREWSLLSQVKAFKKFAKLARTGKLSIVGVIEDNEGERNPAFLYLHIYKSSKILKELKPKFSHEQCELLGIDENPKYVVTRFDFSKLETFIHYHKALKDMANDYEDNEFEEDENVNCESVKKLVDEALEKLFKGCPVLTYGVTLTVVK